ncbi:hypothetical protein, partial [Akkermansia muciniphila]|uniref:hypothetical protein n=1 Tax=Akkermansia muciniphila TaxID=239935 RepID=UPI001F0181DF
ALDRQGDAPAGVLEDGDIQLLCEIVEGIAHAGLGDEKVLCRLADGAAFCHLDEVFELLDGHEKSPPIKL